MFKRKAKNSQFELSQHKERISTRDFYTVRKKRVTIRNAELKMKLKTSQLFIYHKLLMWQTDKQSTCRTGASKLSINHDLLGQQPAWSAGQKTELN